MKRLQCAMQHDGRRCTRDSTLMVGVGRYHFAACEVERHKAEFDRYVRMQQRKEVSA